MRMNAPYQLKTLRKTFSYDEVCLSAFLCHGIQKIGKFHDCPDTGKAVFEFYDAQERMAFEQYIQDWWFSSEYVALCSIYSHELLDKDLAQDLPIPIKMRCWVSLKAGAADLHTTWKWPSRNAKQALRPIAPFLRIANR